MREANGWEGCWFFRRQCCQNRFNSHDSRWSSIPLGKRDNLRVGNFRLDLDQASTGSPTVYQPRTLSLSKVSFKESTAFPCREGYANRNSPGKVSR